MNLLVHGHIFKAGIQWRNEGYQAVSKAIEDAGSKEADKMKRSLRLFGHCRSLSTTRSTWNRLRDD